MAASFFVEGHVSTPTINALFIESSLSREHTGCWLPQLMFLPVTESGHVLHSSYTSSRLIVWGQRLIFLNDYML